MAELIDRQALLEKLKECAQYHSSDTYIGNIYDAIDEIVAAPTVDAVEVVRCGKCKHWLKDVAGCTDNVGRCEWANYMVGAAGYCVYGERREDDGCM